MSKNKCLQFERGGAAINFQAHIKVLLFAVLGCSLAAAQRANSSPSLATRPGSAEGQLTVTLTVVTSVGAVMDANGQPKLIVANSPDPQDNVSSLKVVQLTDNPRLVQRRDEKKKK